MSTSSSKKQAPADRRLAEVELGSLITKFAADHQRLVGTTRRWLQKRLPTAYEIVYEYRDFFVISYSPSEHGYEGVLSLRADEEGVKLYLNNGKGLPDPAKLLQGSAKLVRWIEIEQAATLKRPEVAALVDAALKKNKLPFADSGKGPILIRSTTAKKKSRG